MSFLAESDRSRSIHTRSPALLCCDTIERFGECWRENGEKKGLTDSTSWRVKTLVDMVDGGKEDVSRERRNTVSASDEIKGRNKHVILCAPIPGKAFGASRHSASDVMMSRASLAALG